MIKEDVLNKIIEDGPECLVYMAIEMLGGFAWRMNHDMAKPGRIPEESHAAIDKDVAAAREQSKQLLTALPRFGVEAPTDEEGRPTKEYWKWFRWWNEWHQGMSNDDWRRINNIITLTMTEEQIAECRPEGRWQDHDGEYHYTRSGE